MSEKIYHLQSKFQSFSNYLNDLPYTVYLNANSFLLLCLVVFRLFLRKHFHTNKNKIFFLRIYHLHFKIFSFNNYLKICNKLFIKMQALSCYYAR